MRTPFSVVIPVLPIDAAMIAKTLPSWLSLGPAELLICVDWPLGDELKEAIRSSSKGDPRVKVVEVRPDPAWSYMQALVRRTGFKAAANDVILTGDSDIDPNPTCLKAVEMVGKGGLGLVSLSKSRGGSAAETIRNIARAAVSSLTGEGRFTGLYALYRPYWLDSEPEEELKAAVPPGAPGIRPGSYPYVGDDAFLRDYMVKKHKIALLADVGGTDLRVSLGDREKDQAKLGIMYAQHREPFYYVLMQSLIYVRPTMMGTYADLVARRDGGMKIPVGYILGVAGMARLGMAIALWKMGAIRSPLPGQGRLRR